MGIITGDRTMATTEPRAMSMAQRLAGAAGVLFLAIGVLGFIPGITTNLGDMTFAGPDSGAELFGVFQVSVLHNLVHLGFGAVGLAAMTATYQTARLYLLGGGALYLALWIYGLVVDQNSDANVVPLNDAANWLHLGFGVGMIALGLLAGRENQGTVIGRKM